MLEEYMELIKCCCLLVVIVGMWLTYLYFGGGKELLLFGLKLTGLAVLIFGTLLGANWVYQNTTELWLLFIVFVIAFAVMVYVLATISSN